MRFAQKLSNPLFKQTLIYMVSRYYKQGLLFVKSIMLSKLLSLDDYGIFGWFLTFVSLSMIINLGTINSMNKELTLSADENYKKQTVNQTYTFLILSFLFFSLISIVFLPLPMNVFGWSLVIVIVAIGVEQVNAYYENIFRTLEKINPISVGNMISVSLDIGLLAILYFLNKTISVNYVFLVYIVSVIFINLFYLMKVRQYYKIKFVHWKELKSSKFKAIIWTGIMLLLYELSYSFFLNTDKIIVGMFKNLSDLAQYTFSINIVKGTFVILTSINYVLYSRLLRKFSKEQSEQEIQSLTRIFYALGFLVLFINIALYFASRVPISLYFQQYTASISILKPLLLFQVFTVTALFGNIILIAQSKEKKLLSTQMIALAINFSLCLATAVFLKAANDLHFIAVATGVAQYVFSLHSLYNCYSCYVKRSKAIRLSFLINSSLLVVVLAIYFLI